ncbi:MAG: ABC transporter substrate-binding protein [Chloroflexota bacterium]
MAASYRLSRRMLVFQGLGVAGVSLVAACAPQPAAPPTPARPATEPAKPTAAPAAAAPTAAPAAAPTSAPAAAKPAEAKPAEAKPAGKPDARLGAQLIGKIEGPEVLKNARRPPKLGESPMLAELVKAGKLPPVEQRVPEEPMVLKPLHGIGKYGGTWRRGFTGPADGENFNRVMGMDKPLFVDYSGNAIIPSVFKGWQLLDGGRTIRLSLRKGMKWSDGQPFTADAVMFWYEDLYLNKEITRTPSPELSINGKPGTLVKVDDLTVEARFPDPYPMFVDVLAGFTQVGAGHALGGTQQGGFTGFYAPGHYLRQFHPKYTPKEELDKRVADAKLDNWVLLLKQKTNFQLNPEVPVLTPWRTVSPVNTPSWTLERNPYFWQVDSEGNQLPYIDKISLTLGENLEVINLRAIAGEYDEMGRHLDVAKLPVFLENRQKGNYKVVLDLASEAAITALHVNQSFDADPEVAKWLQNRDFRRALSLGIDRDQINEAFFLGMGTPSSLSPEDSSLENPGPEWRTRWATLDPKQANELLDKIGLDKKDAEGFRLRTDGKGRLRIEITTVAASMFPFAQQMEMVAQHWKKIGIQADVKDTERSLAIKKAATNEHQIYVWSGGSAEIFLWPRHDLPTEPEGPFSGTLYATWFASNGAAGKKPTDPELLKAYDLLRAGAGVETAERNKLGQELKRLICDNLWVIGTVGFTPVLRTVSNRMGNVPDRYSLRPRSRYPGSAQPTTYFFKD